MYGCWRFGWTTIFFYNFIYLHRNSDSDVADSSSDDGSGDNRSQRRTSLSSEEGECVEKNNTDDDAPCDSQRSLSAKKHSIGESDDRPKAKKPKNASQPLTNTKGFVFKTKRPDVLVTKPSESDLKRWAVGCYEQSKEVSQKKVNTRNFWRDVIKRKLKTNDGTLQKRTIGLLKANKYVYIIKILEKEKLILIVFNCKECTVEDYLIHKNKLYLTSVYIF